MHEAHSKLPECSKWQQRKTQEGSNTCSNHATKTKQMSETKRRQHPTGQHKAGDMRKRAESGGQRACMRHTASCQRAAHVYT